jgi:hypothetical protein
MKAEDIVHGIHLLNLDYEKNNIFLMWSNYNSMNRKLISSNIVEVNIKEEVDGKLVVSKGTASTADSMNSFAKQCIPFGVIRTMVISWDEENSKWQTIADIDFDLI